MVAGAPRRDPRHRGNARREEVGIVSQALLEERSGLRHRERARARAGLWLRAQVFLSRLGLDRALAQGADPLSSPKLALRASRAGSL